MRKMKDSGIEWIGDIPEGWGVEKLKRFTHPHHHQVKKLDGVYVGLEHIESSTGKYIPNPEITSEGSVTCFSHNDILYSKLRPYLAKCIIAPCDGFCTAELLVFHDINGNHIFLFYLMLSHGITNIVNASTYGTKMPRANWNFIGDILIPAPSLTEQQRIADFLDSKCASIDRIIEKQRTVIEKLKAYKQSVITEAVTKGLNPDVPMKDSGIEWIGEIPEEWKVRRIRFLVSITTGNKDTINRDIDGEYPFYVRSPRIERIKTYTFDGEAILMAGDGVGAGKVFHYVTGKFDYHQRVYNIHNFKEILGKYLYYFLRENFLKKIEECNAKSTVDSVRLPMLLNFPVVFANIAEQQQIADYLDQKCAEIDKLITAKESIIKKLTSYKQSLIYEAVTGKMEI